MTWIYATPIIENRTRDRIQITSFSVDAQTHQITITYAEGHESDEGFVPVGDVAEASFSAAEVSEALRKPACRALYQGLKEALYDLLAGRLEVPGVLDQPSVTQVEEAAAEVPHG